MKGLSDISNKICGQPMFGVLSKVQELERKGRKILHFELGEPDFRTPDNIIEAGVYALRNNLTHYENSQGMFAFRTAVQNTTQKTRRFRPELSQILITPGANAIIYYMIKCVVNPGDDILLPNPGFPTYFSAAAACGVNPVSIRLRPEKNFIMQPEDIEAAITPRTRLLIINSPSNPTGAVIPEKTMREIYEITVKHELYLVSDEIYVRLIYNNEHFFSPSMLDHCRERTLVINGFSKAFAMTGWRLGVAIGPTEVIEKMALLNETIVSCVPPFVQFAGIEAINGDQSVQRAMATEYRKRCFYLAEKLNELPGISCPHPDGSIYVFPDVRGTGMTSDEFTEKVLTDASVAILPGNSFGKYGEGFVRFSCVCKEETIAQAVHNIKAIL